MIGVIDRLSRIKDEHGRPILSNMEIQRMFATFLLQIGSKKVARMILFICSS